MRRRLRRGRVAAALAILGILALVPVGFALTHSSLFRARTLRVEGASFRSPVAILREAGLDANTNVIDIDKIGVVAALRLDPWIADAWIETHLPSTLVVHVRERVPIAVAGGQAVAADGVVLPGGRLQGLPVLRSSTGSLRPDHAAAAASVLDVLPGAWRRRVEIVLLLPDATIELRITDGLSVVWGSQDLGEEKVTSLRAVARWVEDRGYRVAVIDVSVPVNPSARLADGTILTP